MLTAPQNGVVTTLAIAAGATVSDPTATLMTVSNLESVYVTANVAESDIGQIAIGDRADIDLVAYPGRTLHGRVAEVNAVIQPDTRRQQVRVVLPNTDGRLLPNMYATVKIAIPSAGKVFVPQSALLMNNDTVSVLVEVQPWVFRRRAVQIGDETDTTAHVLKGLKAGDRVIVRGGVLLND
jgi:cobalt-zinc-cadmium efflux system membrane fusion protein